MSSWVSKKVYAILSNDEEGKKIIDKLPTNSQDETDKEVDAFFQNKGISQGQSDSEKQEQPKQESKMPESEKILVKEKLKNVWRASNAGPKIEWVADDIINRIENLPESQRKMIIDALNSTVRGGIYQSKGKGIFNWYKKSILLDRNILFDNPYYERQSEFFHEIGHAIDNMMGGYISSFASSIYVSPKHNKTLCAMIGEEASKISDSDFEKIIIESNKGKVDYYKGEIDKSREAYEKEDEKVDDLLESIDKRKKEIIIRKFGEEALGLSKFGYQRMLFAKVVESKGLTISQFNSKSPEEQQSLRNEINKNIEGKVKEFGDFMSNIEKDDKELFGMLKDLETTKEKRSNAYSEFLRKKYRDERVWSCCADLIGAAKHKQGADGINFGHDNKYWNDRTKIGHEAFAEFFEGLTNHAESYENMKRLFPKSHEIFMEIMEKYGR